MCNGSRIEHTKRWVRERLIYMDSVFQYGDFLKSATIRSNTLGEVTLRLKTYSPQWVQISFSDQATGICYQYCDKDKWYEFTGVIQNAVDNNIPIRGINNVMYIQGLEFLNVSSMLMAEATNLVEIDIHGSNKIQNLELGQNVMLQKLNCKGCKNLGVNDNYKSLNLSNCVNLRYLDLSDSQIGEVQLNLDGGALEYLDLSNTEIVTLDLRKQEFLPELKLDGCTELATFNIEGCNELTRISMPNTKLSSFSVFDCNKLEYLDISNTGYLKNPDLSGCESLTTLKMAGLTNTQFRELDVRTLTNLTHLDVSKCFSLNNIRFEEGYDKLEYLNLAQSGIKTFQYGRNDIPDYLDMAPFTRLNNISFNNCTEVEYIKNLTYTASGSSSPFYNCKNLISIEGTVTLRDGMNDAFNNCLKLTGLPNLNLTNVTSASQAFWHCESLTYNQMVSILRKLVNCTNFYRTFADCKSVVCDGIKKELVSSCKKMTNMTYTFTGIPGLKGQMELGFFDENTNLTNIYHPFSGGAITGYIPPSLFAKCTKLQQCEGLFAGMTEIETGPDETMFAKCPKLSNTRSCFSGMSNATFILKEEFFANCPNLNLMASTFSGCKGLVGSIPPNLLKDKTKLTEVNNLFNGCIGLTGEIPAEMFKGCRAMLSMDYLFNGCSGLTGPINTSFWEDCSNVVTAPGIFSGCSGLGGDPANMQEIPEDFFKEKYKVTDLKYLFSGCSQLGFQLKPEWFKDCRALTKISGIFQNCKGANGDIPANLFIIRGPNIDEETQEFEILNTVFNEAAAVFEGCEFITGTIPENLFEKFLSVRDLSGFFDKCKNLEGGIPANLLKRCYSVTNVSRMFARCTKLGRYAEEVTEDDPYFIDPDFFSNCASITNMSDMFNHWDWGCSQRGEIPPTLFRYCPKLENIYGMFQGTGGGKISGDLPAELFRYNTKLKNVGNLFWGANIKGELSPMLFSNTYNKEITNFSNAFRDNSNLTGSAPALWEMFASATSFGQCFQGCTKLDNYDTIPNQWK